MKVVSNVTNRGLSAWGRTAAVAALLGAFVAALPSVARAQSCTHPQGAVPIALLGDLNGSGQRNVADVVCSILCSLADAVGNPLSSVPCLTSETAYADVSCDGSADLSDVLAVVYLSLDLGVPSGMSPGGDGCPAACEACNDAGMKSCLIGEQCIKENTRIGADLCQICLPDVDPAAWTAQTPSAFYRDDDEDSYGLSGDSLQLCAPIAPHSATTGDDCDDGDAAAYPGAPELCDNKDNDCDSTTDNGFTLGADLCDSGDADGCDDDALVCDGAQTGTECVDAGPALEEICGNGEDDDCNGETDEGCTPSGVGCYAHLAANPAASSGEYSIDPDGAGGNAPVTVYCNFDMDGSGAVGALVLEHNTGLAAAGDAWANYQNTEVFADASRVNDAGTVCFQGYWYLGISGQIVGKSFLSGTNSSMPEDTGDVFQPDVNTYFNNAANGEWVGANQYYSICGGSAWTPIGSGTQKVYVRDQPRSCKQILDAGRSRGNDVYVIDVDGVGGNAPISVYCDMTLAGGGWTRIANDHTIQGTTWNSNSYSSFGIGYGEILVVHQSGSVTAGPTYPNSRPGPVGVKLSSVSSWWVSSAGPGSPCSLSVSTMPAQSLVGTTGFIVSGFGTSTASIQAGAIEGVASCTTGDNSGSALVDIFVREPSARTSCQSILDQGLAAGDGVYSVDPDGAGGEAAYDVYCDMTTNGGGWTLLMKADGVSKTVFQYDDPLWTNASVLNDTSLNLSAANAKFPPMNSLPVNELRGCFPSVSHCATYAPGTSGSATDVFAGPSDVVAGLPQIYSGWSVQPNCQHFGLNTPYNYNRARFGWVANQEGDCSSLDSSVGLGLGRTPAAGDGPLDFKWGSGEMCISTGCSNGYMDAGMPGILWGRYNRKSCRDILASGASTGSGTYMIDPDGPGGSAAYAVYCDMTTDGGGWTLVGVARGGTNTLWSLFDTWVTRTAPTADPTNPAATTSQFSRAFVDVAGTDLMASETRGNVILGGALFNESLRDVFGPLGALTAWPGQPGYLREWTITSRTVGTDSIIYGTDYSTAGTDHWYAFLRDAGGDNYAFITTRSYSASYAAQNEADQGFGANEEGVANSQQWPPHLYGSGLAFDIGSNATLGTFDGISFALWVR